jgi:hypothetical protein
VAIACHEKKALLRPTHVNLNQLLQKRPGGGGEKAFAMK